jgi:hypothetical protein
LDHNATTYWYIANHLTINSRNIYTSLCSIQYNGPQFAVWQKSTNLYKGDQLLINCWSIDQRVDQQWWTSDHGGFCRSISPERLVRSWRKLFIVQRNTSFVQWRRFAIIWQAVVEKINNEFVHLLMLFNKRYSFAVHYLNICWSDHGETCLLYKWCILLYNVQFLWIFIQWMNANWTAKFQESHGRSIVDTTSWSTSWSTCWYNCYNRWLLLFNAWSKIGIFLGPMYLLKVHITYRVHTLYSSNYF